MSCRRHHRKSKKNVILKGCERLSFSKDERTAFNRYQRRTNRINCRNQEVD